LVKKCPNSAQKNKTPRAFSLSLIKRAIYTGALYWVPMDKKQPLFTIAHISDLHFSKVSFGLSQFFSKRWIGNVNLIFNRRRVYKNERPFSLIRPFIDHKVSHVCIVGDVSTTSSEEEFSIASRFMQECEKEHMKVLSIPGNHDAYTKRSYKRQLFYKYFQDDRDKRLPYCLQKNKVSAYFLGHEWWVVKLDTTYPAPFYHSTGKYTEEIDDNLRSLLSALPSTASIIMMNHFPLFYHEHPRRIMYGAEKLRETLSMYPNVKLYLHGHTHRHSIADLRGNHLPIVVDSGSAAHVQRGSWNLITIYPSHCTVTMYSSDAHLQWHKQKTLSYEL